VHDRFAVDRPHDNFLDQRQDHQKQEEDERFVQRWNDALLSQLVRRIKVSVGSKATFSRCAREVRLPSDNGHPSAAFKHHDATKVGHRYRRMITARSVHPASPSFLITIGNSASKASAIPVSTSRSPRAPLYESRDFLPIVAWSSRTLASLKSPVAGSPVRLNATAPAPFSLRMRKSLGAHHGSIRIETFDCLARLLARVGGDIVKARTSGVKLTLCGIPPALLC
jgi:hypothetical protein